MCPKTPKIEKADPVQAPAPVASAPTAPVLNEASLANDTDNTGASVKRRGRSALTIPLTSPGNTGINIPT